MNSCSFSGRLARDAEIKDVGETKVCNLTIGSNVGFGDHKKTLWIECAIWGKKGEALMQYLLKGQQIFVDGELSTREYEKDGSTKIVFTLRVNNLDFGSAPKNSEIVSTPNSAELNDEIPF